MSTKEKTDTQYRQTELSEYEAYAETVKTLERLRQKYLEFILKLKGAKK